MIKFAVSGYCLESRPQREKAGGEGTEEGEGRVSDIKRVSSVGSVVD